jgi:hypothetical protein
VLCAFIAAIAMLSPHVTPHQAGVLALAGGLATLVGGLVPRVEVTTYLSGLAVGRMGAIRAAQRAREDEPAE